MTFDRPTTGPAEPAVCGWLDPAVVALGWIALFTGFGQFGVVTALSDVASTFGHIGHGSTIADRAGLSGSTLGLGLATLRLVSLLAVPLSALADRIGRRKVVVVTCALGLTSTVASAASPSFWWFVAIFAVGRPLLSTTITVSQVAAAEHTGTVDRAKAVALITAGYGLGAGMTAVIHGSVGHALGFRWFFLLAVAPLVGVGLARPALREPALFERRRRVPGRGRADALAVFAPAHRRRLFVVGGLACALAVVTGPGNAFVFLYVDDVVRVHGGAVVAMVLTAAPVGLIGLAVGRVGADRYGRRPVIALSLVVIAAAAIVTYSGSRLGLVGGYELQIFAGSVFAPAVGAVSSVELFPTEVRGAVAGWLIVASVVGASVGLLVFGAIADVANRFGTAAFVVAVPVWISTVAVALLPETKDTELGGAAP